MRSLPNWIESYLHYTRFHEAQEQFHRWTALTVLSTAVNRNCWMDAGYHKVFPNLYVLFLGPSSVGKSSSSGIGIEMLQETSLKLNIYKDSITSAALLKFMSDSAIKMEIEGKIVHKTPTLLYASELGNLLSIRTGARELTLLLTELFNKSGDHEDRTNSRGSIKISKPCLNFHGCCFPGWIDEELPSMSLRSGFFGRMLVVKAMGLRHKKGGEIIFTPEDHELRAKLIADLEVIGALYGQMVWSPEARKEWLQWYQSQPTDFSESSDTIEVEGFVGRKAQFIQRLAMLSAIARNDPGPDGEAHRLVVELGDLMNGRALVKQCEEAARSLGAKSHEYRDIEKLKKDLKFLMKKLGTNVIDISTIMRRVSWYMDKKKLGDAVDQLILEQYAELDGRKLKVFGDAEQKLIV